MLFQVTEYFSVKRTVFLLYVAVSRSKPSYVTELHVLALFLLGGVCGIPCLIFRSSHTFLSFFSPYF